MKKLFSYKRIYMLGLTPISIILILIARTSSYFAEQIYAKHIYKFLSQVFSTITGIVPISLGEVLVIAFPVVLLVLLVRLIMKLNRNKGKRSEILTKGCLNLLCTGSLLLFLFTIFAGLNYYRYPFGKYSDLEIQESSLEELYAMTEYLALQSNELRSQIPATDENGVFRLSENYYQTAAKAAKAYELLAEEYPIIAGYYGAPKPVFISEWMSKAEITGMFFPFTMEANVNVDIPDYSIPSTMLHELAHLRGFMREDEANFLAYLAGIKSDSVEFRYSSSIQALIVAGNALYKQNPELYFKIREQYSEGVLLDIRADVQYWAKYDDKVISTVSNKINDSYLKANNQSDGVQSYGRMLDLLLAKYRQDKEAEE